MLLPPSPAKAGRAVEAVFLTLFGLAWLGLWYTQTHAGGPLGWLIIVVEAWLLLACAVRKYRRHHPALVNEAALAEKKRVGRILRWAVVAQGVLIIVAVEVPGRSGHAEWTTPAAIGLTGLLFFALAAPLRRPHHLTGGALLALAALYPVLAAEGPADPVGLFGAGLILWAGAALAIAG